MDDPAAASAAAGDAAEPKARRIEVVVRVKPKTPGSAVATAEEYFRVKDARQLQLKLRPSEEFTQSHHVNNRQLSWDFKFSQVLVEATQEAVYNTTVKPMLSHVLAGYNATVLCYGQTGAGKTHTMMGPKSDYGNRGLCPRAVAGLFECCAAQDSAASTVRMSYMEIYNDGIYDLLNPDAFPVDAITGEIQGDPTLKLQEDKAGNCLVKGLTKRPVHSEDAALELLYDGELQRAVAEHRLNAGSTRSHCVLTFYVETTTYGGPKGGGGGGGGGGSEANGASPAGGRGAGDGGDGSDDDEARVVNAKLHLVDLAGSERVSKTASTGKVAAEAKHINKSLTFLEQVVVALGDRRRTHVPFRNSKLTHVLHDSLGGNCMTLMVANVWGDLEQLPETAATLRFASRMLRVKNVPRINDEAAGGGAGGRGASAAAKKLITSQQREIAMLRQELALHDTFAGLTRGPDGAVARRFTPLSTAAVRAIRKTAEEFVRGELRARGGVGGDGGGGVGDSGDGGGGGGARANVFELFPDLHSARVVDAYFHTFREMLLEAPAPTKATAATARTTKATSTATASSSSTATGGVVVGEVVGGAAGGGGGFGLGIADGRGVGLGAAAAAEDDGSAGGSNTGGVAQPQHAAQEPHPAASAGSSGTAGGSSPPATATTAAVQASGQAGASSSSSSSSLPPPTPQTQQPQPQQRQQEIPYAEWCAGPGKELVAALVAAKEQAGASKDAVRDGARGLNESKRRIDTLQAELETAIADTPQQGGGLTDAIHSDSDGDDEGGGGGGGRPPQTAAASVAARAPDPPHIVQLRKDLKAEKAKYRALSAKWKEAKSEGKYLAKCVARCKHELKLEYWQANGKEPVKT